MIVTGGTYQEVCEFPRDRCLFGSGLRSAAAIGEVAPETVDLYTYVGENMVTEANRIASTYNFNLQPTKIPKTITFHYLHNHSHPVRNSNLTPHERTLGPISGDAILRFGLVEGTAVVEGDRVVYDPQSEGAEQFHKNGSQAEKLALVLNRREASSFSGADNIKEMLDYLSSGEHSADIVVIKCGTAGAIVRYDNKTVEIPVYETDTVWNIGSGDVFSAMFAIYWAEQKRPAEEAAENASLATAYFCSTRELPIPTNPTDVDGFDPTRRGPTIDKNGPKIYLASPFFNPGEFWLMEEMEKILSEEGADVFAPYFDVGHVEDYEDQTTIAQKDLKALEQADVLLALLDTNDPGTLFEIGYARKQGIPVVVYKTELNHSQSTMLEGTGCRLYSDISTTVFKTIWAGEW